MKVASLDLKHFGFSTLRILGTRLLKHEHDCVARYASLTRLLRPTLLYPTVMCRGKEK